MEIAIMIEGQYGLNWPRWQRLGQLVEELGFSGLFRSDHLTSGSPPDQDSLELWTSLTWLASHTRRIEFGPLVTPISFRHPVLTARTAADLDDLSGGRLVLGMGAGWQEREHQLFGFDLLDLRQRFQRFEEGLEVVKRLLQSDQPVSFQGKFFRLEEAILLPRPQRPGGPPIMVGGSGRQRTLPLAARFASQWNTAFTPLEEVLGLSAHLDELLIQAGRKPEEVKRSLMTGCVFSPDPAEVERRCAQRGRTPDELRQRGYVVGMASEVKAHVERLAQAGLQLLMLQWLELDDLQGIEHLAQAVL
jgi:F420-dependent oxidoreductase-like protein